MNQVQGISFYILLFVSILKIFGLCLYYTTLQIFFSTKNHINIKSLKKEVFGCIGILVPDFNIY